MRRAAGRIPRGDDRAGRAWTELAAERLRGTGRVCLVMPGNDDEYYIDEYLGDGDTVRNVDGEVVELANGIEVLSSHGRTPRRGIAPANSARRRSPRDSPS